MLNCLKAMDSGVTSDSNVGLVGADLLSRQVYSPQREW